ncbi:MAG: M23 family metallopeptidase, partial [Cyanobacteria bacterium J06597_1]
PPEQEEVVCEGDLEHPAPGHRVTSEFGWRVHPVTRRRRSYHNGIDLATPSGTTIRAACDGVVTIAGAIDGYGLYVVINHGNGLTTGYGHLDRIDVVVGQQVTTGDSIGRSGNTGRSTGPHLHFETFLYGEPRNPREFIDF